MKENISLSFVEDLAKRAGSEILKIYNQDFGVSFKGDNSPLTQADLIANKIICEALEKKYPNIPIISEENEKVDYEIRKNWDCFWCIDPLDGTKEFVKRNGEFTVNIALLHKNIPVLGVVYAPVLDELYSAKKGEGAYKNHIKLPLHVKPHETKIAVTSHSHIKFNIKQFLGEKYDWIYKGSSLKFCMVAEGSADIYPRFTPSSEWDSAAADAILRECGKFVYDFETQKPLQYNKKTFLNSSFICK